MNGFYTYNQPSNAGIPGTDVAILSILQSLMRKPNPANAMREMLQQYQRDIPIILRCRTPTNSVTRTNMATLAPPVKKKELLLIQNTSPF